MELSIIGGGPAGLRAAEVAAEAGAKVRLFDAKPSLGRKLLVAGRGGLNLTHGEDFDSFAKRYTGPDQPDGFWRRVLTEFSPDDLRKWAEGLGIRTFKQRTGRVYPVEMKAAPLLRRWIERLRGLGVKFETRHRWNSMAHDQRYRLGFDQAGRQVEVECDAVVLALGGASWPITGSDGGWVSILEALGISVNPLQPANCGWELDWPRSILDAAEGKPLKNIVVRAGGIEVAGELMVTSYGLEGGAIYQLGPVLRSMEQPIIKVDFKPTFTVEELVRKMESVKQDVIAASRDRWKLSEAAHAILCGFSSPEDDIKSLAIRAKACPISLTAPRSIEEAISSAGGVCWRTLDERLMVRDFPGLFVAGEMIDWEAPTGGYLMQGCFATGTLAGAAAVRWLKEQG